MRILACIAAVLAFAVAVPAVADDQPAQPAFTIHGYGDVTSDYVARGTDQNVNRDPALQFGVNTTYKAFYANVFTSNMDYGEGTTRELDFFVGYKPVVKNTTLNFEVVSINYPHNFTPLNFVEYDFGADHPFGKGGNVGFDVGYTPDYFHVYGHGIWTEVHASYPLPIKKMSISGSVANESLPNGFNYATWNTDVSYAIDAHLTLDVRYSDTSRHDLDPIYDTYGRRVGVTLTASF